jgi:hypothetical protein
MGVVSRFQDLLQKDKENVNVAIDTVKEKAEDIQDKKFKDTKIGKFFNGI